MALDRELAERIVASVDEGFADQIAFTQDMIRFGSVRGEKIWSRITCTGPSETGAIP